MTITHNQHPASPSHPTTVSPSMPTPAEIYEQTHVHAVYNTIAPHFSRTRYKPWPIVERFLLSRQPGSVGLDVGCGNGKNLGVNPDVFIVGSDRSDALVNIAAQRHFNFPSRLHKVHHARLGSEDGASAVQRGRSGKDNQDHLQHRPKSKERRAESGSRSQTSTKDRSKDHDGHAHEEIANSTRESHLPPRQRLSQAGPNATKRVEHPLSLQQHVREPEIIETLAAHRRRSNSEQQSLVIAGESEKREVGKQCASDAVVVEGGETWAKEPATQASPAIRRAAHAPVTANQPTGLDTSSVNTDHAHTDTAESCASVLVADSLSLPHPLGLFDFAICIAVIHHLSTRDRRVQALQEILSCLRTLLDDNKNESTQAGQALIFVWALEQDESRRGYSKEKDEQDQLVPWVLKDQNVKKQKQKQNKKPRRVQLKPQFAADNTEDPDQPKERSGDDTSKLSAVRVNDSPHESEKEHVQEPDHTEKKDEGKTYHRYYHLYTSGELESECVSAGGKVVDGGYERDNWWCVVEPG